MNVRGTSGAIPFMWKILNDGTSGELVAMRPFLLWISDVATSSLTLVTVSSPVGYKLIILIPFFGRYKINLTMLEFG